MCERKEDAKRGVTDDATSARQSPLQANDSLDLPTQAPDQDTDTAHVADQPELYSYSDATVAPRNDSGPFSEPDMDTEAPRGSGDAENSPPEDTRLVDGDSPVEMTVAESPSSSPGRIATGSRFSRSASDTPQIAPDSDGNTIHRYRFVEQIARGGMGKVMRAVDPHLHREVACKMVLDASRAGTAGRERFIEEAQITGQLEHPGIVPVHELGKDGSGNPYYTMKLIRGTSLKQVIHELHEQPVDSRGRHLQFTRLLGRFVDVCNTVAFAHQRGVLHRDLKPDNIMLGDFGETYVVDWGVAKLVGSDQTDESNTEEMPLRVTPLRKLFGRRDDSNPPLPTGAVDDATSAADSQSGSKSDGVQTDARSSGTETMAGQILGTLNYMSPEQADGRIDELDARTDIYSLGAILYDILTGQRTLPEQSSVPQLLEHIRKGNIAPPRETSSKVPRALDAVCMTALESNPDDRYSTALALAADVEAWIAGDTVSVYREPWLERAGRWARSHRFGAIAILASLVLLPNLAWFQVQARQVAQVEADARQAIASAETAAAEGRTDDAHDLLQQAQIIASTQPQLVELAATVSGRQEYVAKLVAVAESKRHSERIVFVEGIAELNEDIAEVKLKMTEAKLKTALARIKELEQE